MCYHFETHCIIKNKQLFTLRHNIVNNSITQENRAKGQISLKSSLPATTENEFNLLNSINLREDSIPHLVSINEHNGFIQPEKLHVTAQCYPNGVNVTFQVDGSNVV
uniref:Uncharacterized protein n=1 Tax=Heterorhabditis bacteriophora TaxID=37862 RepID=A0A1I7X387_HETBA